MSVIKRKRTTESASLARSSTPNGSPSPTRSPSPILSFTPVKMKSLVAGKPNVIAEHSLVKLVRPGSKMTKSSVPSTNSSAVVKKLAVENKAVGARGIQSSTLTKRQPVAAFSKPNGVPQPKNSTDRRAAQTGVKRLKVVDSGLIDGEKLGTVWVNGFELVGVRSLSLSGKSLDSYNHVLPHHYPLNLGTDTRYVTAYQNIGDRERTYMILAEVQQNVMDWATETLAKTTNANDSAKPTWLSTDTFLAPHGLYGQVDLDLDSKRHQISVSRKLDKHHDDRLIFECVVENATDCHVWMVQFGMDMLSANRLHLATTTKQVADHTRALPLAGGHGVGMKQLMALFAHHDWTYELMGSLPSADGLRDHVGQWNAIRDGGNFGVLGQVCRRSSMVWPASFKSDILSALSDSGTSFLCTHLAFPKRTSGLDDVWQGLLASNIVFTVGHLALTGAATTAKTIQAKPNVATDSKNGVVYADSTVALVKNVGKIGAFYINGTPCLFSGLSTHQPLTLNVLITTADIRRFSRDERVYSAVDGVERILTLVETAICSVLGPEGSSSSIATGVTWFKSLVNTAFSNPKSAEAGLLFRLQCSRIQRQVGHLLNWGQCFTLLSLKPYHSIMQHLQLVLKSSQTVDTMLAPAFFDWLTRDRQVYYGAGDENGFVDSGFEFACPSRFIQQALLKRARLLPVGEIGVDDESKRLAATSNTDYDRLLNALHRLQHILRAFSPCLAKAKGINVDLSSMTISVWRNMHSRQLLDPSSFSTEGKTTRDGFDRALATCVLTPGSHHFRSVPIETGDDGRRFQSPHVVLFESDLRDVVAESSSRPHDYWQLFTQIVEQCFAQLTPRRVSADPVLWFIRTSASRPNSASVRAQTSLDWACEMMVQGLDICEPSNEQLLSLSVALPQL